MSSTRSGRTLITSKPSHGGSASNSYPPQSTCKTSPPLKAHSRTENIARHKTSHFPFFSLPCCIVIVLSSQTSTGRLTQPPSRSIPCSTVHETVKERHIETREFHIPRILPYGIFVIGCPPAEPCDDNSDLFTISEDSYSLNSVPCRPDVSSPDHPPRSLSGRRLLEDPYLQQLWARGKPVHDGRQRRHDLPQYSPDVYEYGGRAL